MEEDAYLRQPSASSLPWKCLAREIQREEEILPLSGENLNELLSGFKFVQEQWNLATQVLKQIVVSCYTSRKNWCCLSLACSCLPWVVCQHEDEGLHPKRGLQEHHTAPGTACTMPTGVKGKGQQAPVCTNSIAHVHSDGSDRWHQCEINGSNENNRGYNVGMAESEQLQCLCLEQ